MLIKNVVYVYYANFNLYNDKDVPSLWYILLDQSTIYNWKLILYPIFMNYSADCRQLLQTCLMTIDLTQYRAGDNALYPFAIEYWFNMWSTTKVAKSNTLEAVQMINNILIR